MSNFEMSENCNVKEKERILNKQKGKEYLFKNNDAVPFIGDNYKEHKILCIIKKGDDEISIERDQKYPVRNKCLEYLEKNEKKWSSMIDDASIKIDDLACYNLYYDWVKDKPGGKKITKELLPYFEALRFLIGVLKPKMIFCLDGSKGTIDRVTRPKEFDGRSFEEFLKNKGIELWSDKHLNQSDRSKMDELFEIVEKISNLFRENFKGDGNWLNELNENYKIDEIGELDKLSIANGIFSKGITFDPKNTTDLWLNLKRASKIMQFLPVDDNAADLMLEFLKDDDWYIDYRLVPSLIKYFKDYMEVQNEVLMGTENNAFGFELDSINDYLKDCQCEARGVQTILKSMYNRYSSHYLKCVKRFAILMKKRIFVKKDDLHDNEKKLFDKAEYQALLDQKKIVQWTPNSSLYIKD